MVITGSSRPYDPKRNPAYQIDHTVDLSGKVVASTKRRIRFTFGFSNAEALEAGAIGLGCRGSEHTVELVWSLTSGKRRILMDNHEVHYSVATSNETKFSYSWSMPGNVTMTIVAHAAGMSSKSDAPEDWKQYDLLVDDVSYFEMPKVFQLGIKPTKSDIDGAPGFERPAKVETSDLLGFSDPTPAPSQAPAYHAPPMAAGQVQDHAFAFAAPPPQQKSPPQYVPDRTASPPVPSPPSAEVSVAAPVSPGAPVATAPVTTAPEPAVAAPPAVHRVSPATPMQEDEDQPTQEPTAVGLESAMKNNLANFDLGFPAPESPPEVKLTMAPSPGMTVALAEMKAGQEQTGKSPAREVMRAASPTMEMEPPQQQQQPNGYGYGYPQQQQQQWPQHRPAGYGVGAAVQQGGYGGYQQSYPGY